MGLWRDTKTILFSSVRALADGVSLLAEGAAELERKSGRLLLETTVMSLEKKRERLGDEWFTPENFDDYDKLIDSYNEFLRPDSPHYSPDKKAGLDKLYADQRSTAMRQGSRVIELLARSLEKI